MRSDSVSPWKLEKSRYTEENSKVRDKWAKWKGEGEGEGKEKGKGETGRMRDGRKG